jgi:hypothetical protein
VHTNGGRGEWVVRGEHESTPVLAAMVRSVLRAGDNIVPSGNTVSKVDSRQRDSKVT